MNVWYSSRNRFINRIKNRWKKQGFKPNAGQINILKFAYQTVLLYANIRNEKVSKINKMDINPKLF
jgi:hypothetical protein